MKGEKGMRGEVRTDRDEGQEGRIRRKRTKKPDIDRVIHGGSGTSLQDEEPRVVKEQPC